MIETITVRNLPEEFTGTYETDGVWNMVANRFYNEREQTRWVSDVEFEFTNLLMRFMGLIMPGAFKKQTKQYMQQFKEFAEST